MIGVSASGSRVPVVYQFVKAWCVQVVRVLMHDGLPPDAITAELEKTRCLSLESMAPSCRSAYIDCHANILESLEDRSAKCYPRRLADRLFLLHELCALRFVYVSVPN